MEIEHGLDRQSFIIPLDFLNNLHGVMHPEVGVVVTG
jgi:hypothetical protein